MNEQGTSPPVRLPSPRRTVFTAIVLAVAAVVFFGIRLLDGISSAFGAFAGTVDHWPFIYVCVPALFIVAFITRCIGRLHGLVGSLLFTAYVAWICWSAAGDQARAYGWQNYGAQRWLLVHYWSLAWGIAFTVFLFVLPTFWRRPERKTY